MNISKYLITISVVCLTGCASDEQLKAPKAAEVMYKEGINSLNSGNYSDAYFAFEALEKEHPASNMASYAQIRRIYAAYLGQKYDEVRLAADDFIMQYPLHQNIDYVYYLKALSYYDQIVDIGRDQHMTIKAIEALNEVSIRYPNSIYSRDAKLKAEYAMNNLAGKEMEIGRFYLNSNEMIAALNRFKEVIDKYETSIFTPEALYRVCEIYYYLGDEDQSTKYASVLGVNYPNSEWYERAYNLNVNSPSNPSLPWYEGFKKIW